MAATTDRAPLEEMANRAATAGGGLAAAAQAVGLQDHQRMLRDYARRVRDGHRAGMQRLGAEAEGGSEDDELGDIFVCGDITTTSTGPQQVDAAAQSDAERFERLSKKLQELEAAAGRPASDAKRRIWPYVLLAALSGGSLGAGAAAVPALFAGRGDQSVTLQGPAAAEPAEFDETQWELRISSGEDAQRGVGGKPTD